MMQIHLHGPPPPDKARQWAQQQENYAALKEKRYLKKHEKIKSESASKKREKKKIRVFDSDSDSDW